MKKDFDLKNLSYQDLTKLIDEQIKKGRTTDAKKTLHHIKRKRKPPRTYLPVLTSLARRMGLVQTALKFLHPLIRPKNLSSNEFKISDEETLEYAATLIRAGINEEGLNLLEKLDTDKHPRVWLFKSFAHFSQWNYAASVPLLRQYVSHEGLTPYQRLMGFLNYGTALLGAGQYSEALQSIETVLEEAKSQGLDFLQGISYLNQGMVFFEQRKFSQAESSLQKATELLQDTDSLEEFWTKKWLLLLDFYKEPKKYLKKIQAFKHLSIERKDWESARNCDEHIAYVLKDSRAINYVYEGTPFPAWKESFQQKSNYTPSKFESFLFFNRKKSTSTLNLITGKNHLGKQVLKIGSVEHKLLIYFTKDRYRPLASTQVFVHLYPGEYFNPNTSLVKTRVAISRFNSIMQKKFPGLKIGSKKGHYYLHADDGIDVLSPVQGTSHKQNHLLQKIRSEFNPLSKFTIKQLAHVLDVSPRSANRSVVELIQNQELFKTGKGRSTFYYYKPNLKVAS